MQLHLGFMSGAELAEWFGITKISYNRMRKKKLEELKGYCNFVEKHGGVQINEIFDQNIVTYEKPASRAKELTIKNFDTVWGKDSPNHDLDTCANVSIKLEEISDQKISNRTFYRYVSFVRNEKYGRPMLDGGKAGRCIYVWCKERVNENGDVYLVEFTDQEQKIKRELMKKYFGANEERDMLLTEMVNRGEITEAEAYRMQRKYRHLNQDGFMDFYMELKKRLGGEKIVRGTLIMRGQGNGYELKQDDGLLIQEKKKEA